MLLLLLLLRACWMNRHAMLDTSTMNRHARTGMGHAGTGMHAAAAAAAAAKVYVQILEIPPLGGEK